MTARYYYENLDDLITMLETKPTGHLSIMVGSDDLEADIPRELLTRIVTKPKGRDLALYVVTKIRAGELVIKVSGKTDLPQGMKFED